MMDVDEKRRLVRGLLREVGRGFAEPHGFPVTNSPGRLFQLLYLSILLRRSDDYHVAVEAAQRLRDRWDTAQKLAASPYEKRAELLGKGVRRGTAEVLGELAQTVAGRYRRSAGAVRGAQARGWAAPPKTWPSWRSMRSPSSSGGWSARWPRSIWTTATRRSAPSPAQRSPPGREPRVDPTHGAGRLHLRADRVPAALHGRPGLAHPHRPRSEARAPA
ncbi:hypothetical protein OHA25_44030 [Nonomuraea sp. NBC_00507]|uniref:hypothetical protein n=1 Tax=Nonomuraea sp. NBC_00507 TaxID=2976002 RepID=UPI002E1920BC